MNPMIWNALQTLLRDDDKPQEAITKPSVRKQSQSANADDLSKDIPDTADGTDDLGL